MSAQTDSTPCLICGTPVYDYEPRMCCDGRECGCMGQPTNPATCSEECDEALFDNIGMTYEQRRIKCGIQRWAEKSARLPAKEPGQ